MQVQVPADCVPCQRELKGRPWYDLTQVFDLILISYPHFIINKIETSTHILVGGLKREGGAVPKSAADIQSDFAGAAVSPKLPARSPGSDAGEVADFPASHCNSWGKCFIATISKNTDNW